MVRWNGDIVEDECWFLESTMSREAALRRVRCQEWGVIWSDRDNVILRRMLVWTRVKRA